MVALAGEAFGHIAANTGTSAENETDRFIHRALRIKGPARPALITQSRPGPQLED
jgi:hypothetical protein